MLWGASGGEFRREESMEGLEKAYIGMLSSKTMSTRLVQRFPLVTPLLSLP